jgi:hypothetical protein
MEVKYSGWSCFKDCAAEGETIPITQTVAMLGNQEKLLKKAKNLFLLHRKRKRNYHQPK